MFSLRKKEILRPSAVIALSRKAGSRPFSRKFSRISGSSVALAS